MDIDAGQFSAVDDDEQEIDLDLDGQEEAPVPQEGDEETEGPVSFSFGDEEEPEKSKEPDDTPLVRKLRQELREANRERKRLAEQVAPKPVELGPRPRLEDYEWDQDQFDAALDEWVEKKAKVEQESAQRALAEAEKNREGNQILAEYQNRAKAFSATNRINDYEEATATVEDTLGVEKISLIVAGSPKAEELIYALYKNPRKLEALSKINNLPRFMYEAATLQRDLKVMQGRKSPPADTPIRGNGSSASGDRKLAALEAKAAKTGDRTEVARYKKMLRNRN